MPSSVARWRCTPVEKKKYLKKIFPFIRKKTYPRNFKLSCVMWVIHEDQSNFNKTKLTKKMQMAGLQKKTKSCQLILNRNLYSPVQYLIFDWHQRIINGERVSDAVICFNLKGYYWKTDKVAHRCNKLKIADCSLWGSSCIQRKVLL